MKSPLPILLLGALILAGCPKKDEAVDSAKELARTVRTTPVGTGDVIHQVELIGELQGIEEVRVIAQIAERIRTLNVKEGQFVKQGDLLATVHAELQSEAVNQAQAAVEAASANRDAVLDNLQRTQELAKSGSATRSQLQALEAQARGAEAAVRQAAAGLGQASTNRNRSAIRAPIDGVVSGLMLREGDLAAPGQPLLTLVRDERVKAVFRVPEREFMRIKEGQKATLQPLAEEATSVVGQVTLKGPVVDRFTRTGLVEIHLDNPGRVLVAGSSVRVSIELGRRQGVILVPAEAVLLTADTEFTGKAVAFVTDGKLALRREVKVGPRQGGDIQVVEGLAVGEALVVQGAHFLRNGAPVKVAEIPQLKGQGG